jgi:hypothetical protein
MTYTTAHQEPQVSQAIREIYFSNPQMDVMETTAQRVLMQCGVGSGKSHVIGMLAMDYVTQNPEVRGFIGANTYGQLTRSTLDRVFKVWEDVYNLHKNVDYVVDRIPPESFIKIGPMLKSYENTISFNNGALIFLASLDNYKVIDGTEFGWALLDETKDTKEEAVKEVIVARLRQLGMLVGTNGKIYISKRYNRETKEVDDIAAKKCAEGLWYKNTDGTYTITATGVNLTGYTPLYIFTSPSKTRWISDWFKLDEFAEEIEKSIYSKTDYYRKRRGDQLVVIASTWHNVHNLAPGYIERLERDLEGQENKKRMLIYASPFGKAGGEFYTCYSRLKHVKDITAPWMDEPLHVSFDFNVVPYMTATIWQMKFNETTKRYTVRCIDEFCLPNPDNTTPALCKKIIEKYGPKGLNLLRPGAFYYYGDYSGKNRQTISEEFRDQYEVIEKYFSQWLNNLSDRVIPNAGHIVRRDFMNKIFAGGYPIDVEIGNHCKETKGDFDFVKEDANGKKLKTKITKEGVSFEEFGHCSDTADYFFCSAFENLLILHK